MYLVVCTVYTMFFLGEPNLKLNGAKAKSGSRIPSSLYQIISCTKYHLPIMLGQIFENLGSHPFSFYN